MEKGQVIAFNKAIGKGFILNSNNNLYYLFQNNNCLDEITVGDTVFFEPYELKEAIKVKLQKTGKRLAHNVS